MIFFDTESIGYYGPTTLIQYCVDRNEPVLHNCFTETVGKTVDLIEWMMEQDVVGFNLAHDSFHLHRTYNVYKELPRSEAPHILDIWDVEKYATDKYCLKPTGVLDLMLYGRRDVFQGTLNQKDITLRKVPKKLAPFLVRELYKIEIPKIYFAKSGIGYRWRTIELTEDGSEVTPNTEDEPRDPDFVNIKLQFNPGTSLKNIAEKILDKEVLTLDDISKLHKPEEYSWWPNSGRWVDVAKEHIYAWTHDELMLKYAKNDPILTRDVYDWMGAPDLNDDDSVIAWHVGGMHWHGFEVDLNQIKVLLNENNSKLLSFPVNYNSPVACRDWLRSLCQDEMQVRMIPNTRKETLESFTEDWLDINPELYNAIQDLREARTLSKENDIYTKILAAGRLYVTFKVVGTKSNRSAGGSESSVTGRGGSINPQGIRKGKRNRRPFTLAVPPMDLGGGDFSGFEVTIADAVFNDEQLRRDLIDGFKFHGLFGSCLYNKTYEEVMATEEYNKNDPKGIYQRSKSGVFAWFYGAFWVKIGQVLWLEKDDVQSGLAKMEEKYPGIRRSREKIFEDHQALAQRRERGPITWSEPQRYVESILGFRRHFDLEYKIIKFLYDLAQDPPDDFKSLKFKVMRRDRWQTGHGALSSALYAAAFNLQSGIERAAANHRIQSPGGQITKAVQRAIIDLQPVGIHKWYVMPINIHDELQCPHLPEVKTQIKERVDETIDYYRTKVPLLKMEWKETLNNWSEV